MPKLNVSSIKGRFVSDFLNINEWLVAQVGRSRADSIAEAKAKANDIKHALIHAQRGRTSLQSRAGVSATSKIQSRLRYFLLFATKLDKRPTGTTVADWSLFQEITTSWVENGHVKPEALKVFER